MTKMQDFRVRLLSYTHCPNIICESAAAICVGENPQDDCRHLKAALASGHTSVLEHASYTFLIEGISRVTLAQLTRHRLASFSVQGQRYTKVSGTDPFVLPDDDYIHAMQESYEAYKSLMQAGERSEDARYVLPEGTRVNLLVTMNARELMHFFALRCCERAQWEIRQLANAMLKICQEHESSSEIFKNAGPSCVQLGYCPEKRGCPNTPKLADLKAAYDEKVLEKKRAEERNKSHDAE